MRNHPIRSSPPAAPPPDHSRARYNPDVPAPSRKGPWIALLLWSILLTVTFPLAEALGFAIHEISSLTNLIALANIAVVLALIAWERRILKRRLHRPGHCDHCGYDLRASPHRCPECGAVTAERV